MPRVGDLAPEFEGTTARGEAISLQQFRGRPVVVYFYPKASSLGCSIEAREFAARYPEFGRKGVALIGVSVDSIGAQKRFMERCDLPFPLVADSSKSIARAYGVLGAFGMARRVTFFIGPDGRIEEIVDGLRPRPHVLRAVERLGLAAPAPTASPPGPPL